MTGTFDLDAHDIINAGNIIPTGMKNLGSESNWWVYGWLLMLSTLVVDLSAASTPQIRFNWPTGDYMEYDNENSRYHFRIGNIIVAYIDVYGVHDGAPLKQQMEEPGNGC